MQRLDAQEIFIEEINKPEYNQTKKHLRRTRYQAVEDTEGEISVIDGALTSRGYLSPQTHETDEEKAARESKTFQKNAPSTTTP